MRKIGLPESRSALPPLEYSQQGATTDLRSVAPAPGIGDPPEDNRIDIAVLGEGYTATELDTVYPGHVDALLDGLFGGRANNEPFSRYSEFFNLHVLEIESAQSGADDPVNGVFVDTALDASFSWAGGVDRLLYVDADKADRAFDTRMAQRGATAEIEIVIVNSEKYGGGGGEYAVYAGGNDFAIDVAIHELGHSYADLADEYDFSQGATYLGDEPREVNLTTDPTGAKWADWIGYVDPVLGPIGVYEGGGYHSYGLYRPSEDGQMRSIGQPFHAVSREAFILEFYDDVDPLDGWSFSGAETTVVDPDTLSVTPVDPDLISVVWRVDGQPVGSGPTLDVAGLGLANGGYDVEVVAVDETPWVRRDTAALTQSVSWDITITDALSPAELAIAPMDAERVEGDAGLTGFSFEVTRTVNTAGPLTVDYAVTGAGAAASDFAGGALPSGTVSFADTEASKTITIPVRGDTAAEPDEGFTVTLSNASGDAQITAASAAGTILNDDDGVAAPAGVVRGTGRDDALLLGAGATYLGGAGADLFLQSGAATPGETALIEGRAGDVIQFAPGLGIVEFALQEDALQLDLATGARLRVLNAGSVDFEAGGNVSTGETGQRDDFAGFAADVLGTPLPAGGSVSGGPVTIPPATGTAPGIAEPGEPAGPLGVIRGTERPDALMTGAGATYLGGAADDLFLVSRAATPGETALIEGAAGDVIQLAPDLAIEAFAAQDDALQLDLAGGARARILNADRLDFSVGGNATTGTAGLSQGFGAFLGTTLGISMPGEGETLTGGPLRIGTPTPALAEEADLPFL